jgi:glyoxalase family protein
MGHGLSVEVALSVPIDSLDYWGTRLSRYATPLAAVESRFGERTLPLIDPHGLRVALVESADAVGRAFIPWAHSPVPVTRQIRGLHGARLVERDLGVTAAFLQDVLGFTAAGVERGWHRFALDGGGSGRVLDVREAPEERRGAWGTGSIHHLAWRVADDEHELATRARVEAAGRHPTPVIDRFWFKSVYFKEPGGVLFELATDGPGFAVDEPPAHLGESLVLPPWLESQRRAIEAALPPLALPAPTLEA